MVGRNRNRAGFRRGRGLINLRSIASDAIGQLHVRVFAVGGKKSRVRQRIELAGFRNYGRRFRDQNRGITTIQAVVGRLQPAIFLGEDNARIQQGAKINLNRRWTDRTGEGGTLNRQNAGEHRQKTRGPGKLIPLHKIKIQPVPLVYSTGIRLPLKPFFAA